MISFAGNRPLAYQHLQGLLVVLVLVTLQGLQECHDPVSPTAARADRHHQRVHDHQVGENVMGLAIGGFLGYKTVFLSF